jgi:hypothetical protein
LHRLQTFICAAAIKQRIHVTFGNGHGIEKGVTAMMAA